MSVEMPKNPHSIDSISSSSQAAETTQGSGTPISAKDSLKAFEADKVSTRLTARESLAPELKEPQFRDTSIVGSFRIWMEAIRAFRNSLSASDGANLEARRRFGQLAVEQAEEMSKLISSKSEALALIKKEIESKLGALEGKLEEMRKLKDEMQKNIDKMNGGNEKEKRQYEELMRAYDKYVAEVKELEGVKIDKDGNFVIPDQPPETREKYNELTKNYQASVGNFNDYWKGRSAEIKEYNQAIGDYNQAVEKLNQEMRNLLGNLIPEDKIPQLIEGKERSLFGYLDRIPFPKPIELFEGSITVPNYPLPNYAKKIAKEGPETLPGLKFPHSDFDPGSLYSVLYNNVYESRIAPLDQEINRLTSYWSFVNRQILQQLEDKSSESLLNSKPLAERLIPAGMKVSRHAISSQGTSSLAMQTMGIDSSHVQVLMGRAMLKQAIENSHLKVLESVKGEEREKMIEQLVDQVLILSVGLLGNESILALYPSLGAIPDSLVSLPKDSPAFAIIFAVSLSNRIQEGINQGITAEALQAFLDKNPELAALPTEDKAQLEAALNLGQVLVVGKLLEDSLGLQGLLAQLLPSLLPTLKLEQVIPQAEQEVAQGQLELQTQIKDHFINQGYSEDKAQFLAEVGSDLAQQGLLTPNVTANLSSKTLNQPLLVDSVKAELVMSNYSLNNAHALANEAIDLTLAEGPYPSAKQFRAALESNLVDLQVKNSPHIAAAAVLIPLPEKSLAHVRVATAPNRTAAGPAAPTLTPAPGVTPTLTRTATPAPATTPAPTPAPKTAPVTAPPKLSPAEMAATVEKRTLQLLVPQLGPQLAQQISQEIAKTLFGTPHPDSGDIAEIKSPYALVNVVKNQLYHLNVEQNQNWTNAVVDTFKESVKTMESFYAFSLKIMDPAYLFVFASGIIYGDQGRKKPIDIPI